VLFKSPDKQHISCLAKQLYPGKNKMLLDAYNDCVSNKFSPLIIDMTNDSPDDLRLKTNYFEIGPKIIYKTRL